MELLDKLAKRLVEDHAADAAVALEAMPAADAARAVRAMGPSAWARLLRAMSPHRAAALLPHLPRAQFATLLDAMPPDAAAGVLRRCEPALQAEILDGLEGRAGRTLRTLLRYPVDTAATLMDPHVLALPEDLSVEQAIQQVREAIENILFNVYVVDRQHVLVGVLNLRELLASDPIATLHDVMKPPSFAVAADADRRSIFEHPGWRSVHSLPVVDAQGRFLGALRYRTLQRIQRDAARAAGDREAVAALGELFWTGAAGALDALTILGDRNRGKPR